MIDFGVLGPLTFRRDGQPQAVPTKLLRRTLALLLSRPGAQVQADFIIDTVWFGRPPPTARRTLSAYISRLRQLLGEDDRIESDRGAYAICLRPGELDTSTFESLARRVAEERGQGQVESAASTLRSALALWRGPAYTGMLEMAPVAIVASRLEELRLGLFEDGVRLDLDGGKHSEVIAALNQMIIEHPYRERLRGLQMLALYRCGRQVDALDAYQQTYQQLSNDLGIEPGVDLQRLQRRILAGDPDLVRSDAVRRTVELTRAQVAAPAGAQPAGLTQAAGPPPAQLPADPSGFVARQSQLAELDEVLHPEAGAGSRLAVVTGTAGVGKTALIVRWAHRVRERFPDGQLYADLRGNSASAPAQPAEVLARFLRAGGTPVERIPLDLEDAAAAYRSLLADRRALIVLDNASSADQVRPLLPGGSGCVVLVTSRDRLDGLAAKDGARRLDLGVLRQDEVPALLASVIGADRLAAEPAAVAELTVLCAALPLALRIAAATIAGERSGTISGYVSRLRSGDRLTALSIDGDPASAVRGAFDTSYNSLDAAHQRLFRLLSLMPGTDITANGAAALASAEQPHAAAMLRRLAATHLVEQRGPVRYGMHDLLRLYASEQTDAHEDAAQRAQAIGALLSWYLDMATQASQRLYATDAPDTAAATSDQVFHSDADAISWLNAERVNLVAAVTQAADTGLPATACQLSAALHHYFWHTRHMADWLAVAKAGLVASTADQEPLTLAKMRLNLGVVHYCLFSYAEAAALCTAAYESAISAGWLEGQQASLSSLGNLRIATGELRAAESYHRRSLELQRPGESWRREGASLSNLCLIAYQFGQLRQAEAYQVQALHLARGAGNAGREATALQFLGLIRHALGDLRGALGYLTRARDAHHSTDNRVGLGHTLMDLAEVHRDAGRYALGAEAVDAALAILRATGDLQSEAGALIIRGQIKLHTHGAQAAVADHFTALDGARRIGARHNEAEALSSLAAALAGRNPAEAMTYAQAALAIADPAEFRLIAGRARTALAVAQAADGSLPEALATAEAGLALHRETGHQLGEAKALAVISRLRVHDAAGASAAWQAARTIVRACGAPESILIWPGWDSAKAMSVYI